MRERHNVRQSKLHQIWDRQRSGLRNVAKGVPPDIAVIRGIRQLSNSYAVQHDPDYAPKTTHGVAPKSQPMRFFATLAQLLAHRS